MNFSDEELENNHLSPCEWEVIDEVSSFLQATPYNVSDSFQPRPASWMHVDDVHVSFLILHDLQL